MQHHESTVEGYVARVAPRPEVLGVVVVGSVARGTPRADSDVDVYLVVTDHAYAAARSRGRVAEVSQDGVTYPGGYVDVKLASPGYLTAAVERADDPTRASFVGARVALDVVGDLGSRIAGIVTLPEEAWSRRLAAYRAQARLHGGYFLEQAGQHGDRFLLQHAALHLALAAGRVALARSRTFYGGQKYLTATLAGLDLPERFRTAWQSLVDVPSVVAGQHLLEAVDAWLGPPEPFEAQLSRFISDNELAWLTGAVPPEFW